MAILDVRVQKVVADEIRSDGDCNDGDELTWAV